MGSQTYKSSQTSERAVFAVVQVFSPENSNSNSSNSQGIQGEEYKNIITHIFWQKDSQNNVIIGVILDNDKFIRFIYEEKKDGTYVKQRQNIKYFPERVIPVQKAEALTLPKNERTLNQFQSQYQLQEEPENLINAFVDTRVEIKNYSKDLDLSDDRQDNYTVCYQNYLNQNQVIFKKSDKSDYFSFDFKENSLKKDYKRYIYNYGIKLKSPLKDRKAIEKLCLQFKTVDEFLRTQKL